MDVVVAEFFLTVEKMIFALLAYHILSHSLQSAYVDYLCVHKKERRKGYAKRLLQCVSSMDTELIVDNDNKAAFSLYVSCGFEPIVHGTYEPGMGEIVLKRSASDNVTLIGANSDPGCRWTDYSEHVRSQILEMVELSSNMPIGVITQLLRTHDRNMRYIVLSL